MQESNENLVHFFVQLKKIGTELCTIRKEINHSQQDMAEWLNCDRRKIAEIELGKSFDFELICAYCDKLSIQIRLDFTIN